MPFFSPVFFFFGAMFAFTMEEIALGAAILYVICLYCICIESAAAAAAAAALGCYTAVLAAAACCCCSSW